MEEGEEADGGLDVQLLGLLLCRTCVSVRVGFGCCCVYPVTGGQFVRGSEPMDIAISNPFITFSRCDSSELRSPASNSSSSSLPPAPAPSPAGASSSSDRAVDARTKLSR